MKFDPKRIKAEKIAALKERLEAKPIIKDWWRFDVLPGEEKYRRSQAWESYYKRVRSSTAFALYEKQAGLVKRLNNVPRDSEAWKLIRKEVADVQREARQMLADGFENELQRPQFRDPMEFVNSPDVSQYKIILDWEEHNSDKKAIDYLK